MIRFLFSNFKSSILFRDPRMYNPTSYNLMDLLMKLGIVKWRKRWKSPFDQLVCLHLRSCFVSYFKPSYKYVKATRSEATKQKRVFPEPFMMRPKQCKRNRMRKLCILSCCSFICAHVMHLWTWTVFFSLQRCAITASRSSSDMSWRSMLSETSLPTFFIFAAARLKSEQKLDGSVEKEVEEEKSWRVFLHFTSRNGILLIKISFSFTNFHNH